MPLDPVFRVFESSSASARLGAALAFIRTFPPSQPVTIVAASRAAADDLARAIAVERGATIGLSRFSLTQLAARVAAARLAGRGIAPSTLLGSEAVAARVAFDAVESGALTYLAGVAAMPGFPRALAMTIGELRATGVPSQAVISGGDPGPDLSRLLTETEEQFADASLADRARLFAEATASAPDDALLLAPLVLVDLPLDAPCERTFVAAIIARASAVFATVPTHDTSALSALEAAGGLVERDPGDGALDERDATTLARVRAYLFADEAPPPAEADDSLQFFSAPGEGREAVEVARRILGEARRGVAFDEMAILLRAPQQYQGLLEHALARAGVPAWFDRGTRRPHPAGRAFLALLACAGERLSARRFAEYLSLGQLPAQDPAPASWTPSLDDMVTPRAGTVAEDDASDGDAAARASQGSGDPESRAATGTLPAPRRWEHLLVEAAVVGGDPSRWARRLDGLAEELTTRRDELARDEAQSARVEGITRDLERLKQLRMFALPLIEELADWPVAASWGEWLATLEALAPRVLRAPAFVLRVLADLRPMAAVGPVSLAEVRSVLTERLRLVDAEPPRRRYGRVFVGSPAQARGRSFRVVFVPGLAERMFPQKPRQDPLLGDAARARVDARLLTRPEQSRRERLLLHLAAGAATERLYVSYPRLELVEGRARVPSFYALDVWRGATGRIPDHEALAAAAAAAGDPSLAWPAPANPSLAIDDQEHDLSVLRLLLDAADPSEVRGRAQYLLKLNPSLKRAITDRWARAEKRWTQFDGITRVTDGVRDALASQRLGARQYSLSALQRFATCPYQFLLGAIYRLQPAEQPYPLQRLDPLTRGSLVHAIQAAFFRTLREQGALPVTRDSSDAALAVLDQAVATVGAEYEEKLAPAIGRVWRDELSAIARDLRGWVQQTVDAGTTWTPRYFELAFGLPGDMGRDPRSVPDPVPIDGRFALRGSIDLVEEDMTRHELRVTDHKTGKDRNKDSLVIGGGKVLQPVLYSMAVEQVLGQTVTESQLSFCTSAGGYRTRVVRLTPETRRAGLEALEVIDRAIERGTLAAAPAEGACAWCDFSQVCGPNEELRVSRKPKEWLADLAELRSRP